MKLRKLFKPKPTIPLINGVEIIVIGEKRKWYKNGRHKFSHEIAFMLNGERIGSGKITRRIELKNNPKT